MINVDASTSSKGNSSLKVPHDIEDLYREAEAFGQMPDGPAKEEAMRTYQKHLHENGEARNNPKKTALKPTSELKRPSSVNDGASTTDKDKTQPKKMKTNEQATKPSRKRRNSEVNFSSLDDPADDDVDQPGNSDIPKRKEKVPPIFITTKIKWKLLREKLRTACKDGFTGTFTEAHTRVQLFSSDDYREVTRRLRTGNIDYHTYKLNSERNKNLKVVIRGLPNDTNSEEIEEELTFLGFNVAYIFQMSSIRTGERVPLPLFIVEIKKTNLERDWKEIHSVHCMLDLKVKIELYRKKKGMVQCHKCQRYGHTQGACFNAPRCVKCALGHLTADCPRKDHSLPPGCCLCSKTGHPASYQGCPSKPSPKTSNAKEKPPQQPTESKEQALAPPPTEEKLEAPSTVLPKEISYADATRSPRVADALKEIPSKPNLGIDNKKIEDLRSIFAWINGLNTDAMRIAFTCIENYKKADQLVEKMEYAMAAFAAIDILFT